MTDSELKDWLETVSKIIQDVQISLDNAERLFENKYEGEDRILNHGFFRHHYYQLWFIMTVQLSKLVTPTSSQRYNLHFLLNKLRGESYDDQLTHILEANRSIEFFKVYKSVTDVHKAVAEFKKLLKAQSYSISKISSTRNKLYAHRETGAKPEPITLDDIRSLLDVCIKIYNGIRGGFYNINLDFAHTGNWSIDWVIKKCATK